MVAFSMMPVAFLALSKYYFSKLLLLVAVVAYVIYHPYASYSTFMNTLAINREIKYIQDFVEELDEQEILIAVQKPGPFTVLNVGSVNFHYLNNNLERVQQDFMNHLYKGVYVVQVMKFETRLPNQKSTLRPEYKLENLHEIQYTPFEYLRFSKVTGISNPTVKQ